MMEKKGLAAVTALVAILFVSIVAIVLFVFYGTAIASQEDMFGKALCQNSIMFSNKDKNPDFSREGCNPARIKIDGETRYHGDYVDDLVKKDIADLMAGCWKMVGEGKLMPYTFDYDTIYKGLGYIEFVLICDIVEFENVEPFEGLNFWMVDHKPKLKTESYFEYLYGPVSDDTFNRVVEMNEQYDTSREYAIIWVFARGKLEDKLLDLTPIEVNHEWNGVLFLPYDEIITKSIQDNFNLNNQIIVMN